MEEAAAIEEPEGTNVLEKGVESAVGNANLAETTQNSITPLKRKADGQHPDGTTTKKQKRHDRGPIANNGAAAEEIQRCQDSTEFLISPLLFQKIVHEVVEEMQSDLSFDSAALEALQAAAEGYVVSMFRGKLM
jgi:hypothetical protein